MLLKNLELLPDKSWLEVPSIKQPEFARSRRMSRLRVGERHRNLLLGTRRTGDGLSRRRYGVGVRFVADLPAGQSGIQLHMISSEFRSTAGPPSKRMR